MDRNGTFDMKIRRFAIWFLGFAILVIIWKLSVIESNVDSLRDLRTLLELHKDRLQLTEQQLSLLGQLHEKRTGGDARTIYAVTPTYWRYVQKAELTRISQMMQLVPNVHWIVIEDAETKTDLVRDLIINSHVRTTHLNVKTTPFEKLREKEPRWKKHRGVEQRNAGLKWLRDHLLPGKDQGIVYFMDDDNAYNVRIFKEMEKIKKVGVWPVGLVGGLNAETPILNNATGKVIGYKSGWKPHRPFAIDMAGFAINLELILKDKNAWFSYQMENGYQESEFLSYFVKKHELEPLADNCTKVYVWHTRTEKPVVNGIVPGLEV